MYKKANLTIGSRYQAIGVCGPLLQNTERHIHIPSVLALPESLFCKLETGGERAVHLLEICSLFDEWEASDLLPICEEL